MEKEEDARIRVKSEDLPIKILEEDTSDKQNLSRAFRKKAFKFQVSSSEIRNIYTCIFP